MLIVFHFMQKPYRKGMNPFVHSPSYGSIVGLTCFFIDGMATSQGDGELRI